MLRANCPLATDFSELRVVVRENTEGLQQNNIVHLAPAPVDALATFPSEDPLINQRTRPAPAIRACTEMSMVVVTSKP